MSDIPWGDELAHGGVNAQSCCSHTAHGFRAARAVGPAMRRTRRWGGLIPHCAMLLSGTDVGPPMGGMNLPVAGHRQSQLSRTAKPVEDTPVVFASGPSLAVKRVGPRKPPLP
jgi:hypothetical protein